MKHKLQYELNVLLQKGYSALDYLDDKASIKIQALNDLLTQWTRACTYAVPSCNA